MESTYLAHSPSASGRVDTVASHLYDVAETAARFAAAFGAEQEAKAAGILHDLGKYSDLFAKRLGGTAKHVDHSSSGGWAALKLLGKEGVASALAIQGHHGGLRQGNPSSLEALNPSRLRQLNPHGYQIPDEDIETLLERFTAEGLSVPTVDKSVYQWAPNRTVADMLDVRMLFSALVDADFLETEAHFNAQSCSEKYYRPSGPPLNPTEALSTLMDHIDRLAQHSTAAPHIDELRSDLLSTCMEAARNRPGLFTLSAPTGAGKTLAMLAFALRHALSHRLRRIIVVIPYLSIIEQTAEAYRKAFFSLGDHDWLHQYVLENHSLAGTRTDDDEEDVDSRFNVERRLSENWDAPIVITTSVQFLESLFANTPSACRKLHRLAQSVVLFDEVQTLPMRLAIPTLGALAHLSRDYRATVVFATATQPAFDHLDPAVKDHCRESWFPKEIAPRSLRLFERAKRTHIEWPADDERLSWESVAGRVEGHSQILCIVNLKRHALQLLRLLDGADGLLHLSTNMCPLHRQAVLSEVHSRLEAGDPCRLVSTQCVEAGVDIDFPRVLRAFAPLDAIAQAAGRCNRNGRLEVGEVRVFKPEDERSLYPNGAYRQAAGVVDALLKERGAGGMDIHDEALYREYYTQLYSIAAPDVLSEEIWNAGTRQDFQELARLYRVIDTDAVNVVVPYDLDVYKDLAAEVRSEGLTSAWVRRARPHSIGLYRPRRDDPIYRWLESVPVGGARREAQDWFVYLNEDHYDSLAGLRPPEAMECLIA